MKKFIPIRARPEVELTEWLQGGYFIDQEFYHGTTADFSEFDDAKFGTGANADGDTWYCQGHYLSGKYSKGVKYSKSNGKVITVVTRVKNPLKVYGAAEGRMQETMAEIGLCGDFKDTATETLRNAGYDSVVVYEADMTIAELIVFDAKNLKIINKETAKLWTPAILSNDRRHMELIIKPTEACNFKCTFCSSTDITDEKAKVLDLDQIYAFLKRFPGTQTIIVNGGDPLMVKPWYYEEIIKFLEDNDLDTTLSLTTNLWAFYKKPEMWAPLFNHPRVGVTTSFNYGNTRRITHTEVYTEDIFWKVSDKFREYVGYRPDFISVITDENEDTAIDNVRLAREMDVECKLNYAMASGDQGEPYQLSKIYQTYTEVYDLGLWPWEYNTKQLMHRLDGKASSCPQNRACDEGIRCLQPSGDYYSCGSIGDDREYPINFHQEVIEGKFFKPLQVAPELAALKQECYTCPMFSVCNGCRKTIRDMKKHDVVEPHCKLMKAIAGKIIEINEQSSTIAIDLMPKLKMRKYESVTDGIA